MNNSLEYTYDQNFVITTANLGILNPVNDANGNPTFSSLTPGLYVPIASFNITLLPPKATNVKKVTIKNINCSLTTVSGYLFELVMPSLFRYPIQFLDSLSTFTQSIEHKEWFQLNIPVTLNRLTGPSVFTVDGTGATPSQWLANPAISFTITYHYYQV